MDRLKRDEVLDRTVSTYSLVLAEKAVERFVNTTIISCCHILLDD